MNNLVSQMIRKVPGSDLVCSRRGLPGRWIDKLTGAYPELPAGLGSGMSRPHIFVGTHHKGGTVWMASTFHRLAHVNGFAFVRLNKQMKKWNYSPRKLEYFEAERQKLERANDRPGVFFDYHSAMPDLSACKASRGARGIHLVRDPRDMVISAVRYHLKSDEAWLHVPDNRWGGMTYQEKLASLNSFEDQIAFELDFNVRRTVRNMAGFNDQGVFRNVRYEDLIVDEDMLLFHELCVWLGLGGMEIVQGLHAYWQYSIFGGMRKALESGGHGHISSGKPRQWETKLSPSALELIQRELGTEIESLGYELV
ncbi:MAG: sulfotransferase domain-containing protein [Phycisphaerales bacterium]